jgi:hypothetical protein
MAASVSDIAAVFALRSAIREPKVPASIQPLIDSIRHCISNGSDQNGWKTVDWRGSGRSGGAHKPSNFAERARTNHGHGGGHGGAARARYTIDTPSAPSSIPLTNTVEPAESRRTAWQESSDGFRHSHQKYVSKFKKTSAKVEDTILNTILLGKLNKFSQPNYNEIKEFIMHIIDSGQNEMITCFMKLVFEKAASEEVFCPLYAKLLSELSTRYPVLLTEMANLYTQYMEIFDEVTEVNSETYNEMCKRNVEKKYRRGYSQFLAELIKHNVIDTDTFIRIITKIISQVEANCTNKESVKLNEEFADFFMKIMKAIRTDGVQEQDESENNIQVIRQLLKQDIIGRIQPLTVRDPERLGLSNKARFTFLDIYESIQKIE